MSWRTRKRGRGDQPGLHFRTGRATGHLPTDVMRHRYLEAIVKETKTHDINDVATKLGRQGRSLAGEMRKTEQALAKAERRRGLTGAKIEVVKRVLGVLKEMKSAGRTRVGDSELKHILRTTMQELKVPASAFSI